LAVEEEALPEPLAPLAAYRPSGREPILILSHKPRYGLMFQEEPWSLLTIGWQTEALSGPEEAMKKLERVFPFLTGRAKLLGVGQSEGGPVRYQPLPPAGLPRPARGVEGLLVASGHPFPGLSTTVSLLLGAAAAEAITRKD
jgi:hypothetical protein